MSVELVDGQPVGGVRAVKAERGQTIRLTGVNDTADSSHVDGFGKTLDLQPGQTT